MVSRASIGCQTTTHGSTDDPDIVDDPKAAKHSICLTTGRATARSSPLASALPDLPGSLTRRFGSGLQASRKVAGIAQTAEKSVLALVCGLSSCRLAPADCPQLDARLTPPGSA